MTQNAENCKIVSVYLLPRVIWQEINYSNGKSSLAVVKMLVFVGEVLSTATGGQYFPLHPIRKEKKPLSGPKASCPPAHCWCILWTSAISRGWTVETLNPRGKWGIDWFNKGSAGYWSAYLKTTMKKGSENQPGFGSHSRSTQWMQL